MRGMQKIPLPRCLAICPAMCHGGGLSLSLVELVGKARVIVKLYTRGGDQTYLKNSADRENSVLVS